MKHWIKAHFWPLYAFIRFIWNKNSYFHKTGWVKSIKKGFPCDVNENPVPWMNYPVIYFLQDRLTKNMQLFEYGSGYSTTFYAKLVANVLSIEFNKKWIELIRKSLPNNAEILYVPLDVDGQYAQSILKYQNKFNVIVIDGRDRFNCFRYAIQSLDPSGVIILDDSDRKEYNTIFELAKKENFKKLSFTGLGAADDCFEQTTIFYRNDNCLGI